MKSNVQIKNLIGACLVLLAAAALFTTLYLSTTTEDSPSDTCQLSEGWSISVNGKQYSDVDLESFTFDRQQKGDVISARLTLPDTDTDNPVLRLYSVHSAVTVSLDGEMLYQYGMQEMHENRMVGYGYHFVNLPEDFAGKTLTIYFYTTENGAFTNLEVPAICNNNTMIRNFVIENKIALAINLFLLVFGFCLLVISACFAVRQSKFFNLTYVALFSLGIALWSMCNYDLTILFTYNLKIKAYLEFVSLYIIPVFVLLYFKDSLCSTGHKWTTALFWTTLSLQLVFFVAACALHWTNYCHFPALLKYDHALLALILVNMIVSIVSDLLQKRYHRVTLIIGLIVFMFFAALDLLKYNIENYLLASPFHYVSFLCVGTQIFVICQIIDFCSQISRMLYDAARSKVLEDMAYIDSLTGLFNRRKCEETCSAMDKSGKVFGIISLDLNGLKTINDTKGHAMGDLLIHSFAEILRNTFSRYGIVCRTGGDEFVVLFADMRGVDLPLLYEALHKNINDANAKTPNLDISTAYGFCDNSAHPEWKSADVYREADALMYQNKIAMKGSAR